MTNNRQGNEQKANSKRAEMLLLGRILVTGRRSLAASWSNQLRVPLVCLLLVALGLTLQAQDDAAQKRQYTLFNGTRISFSLGSDAPDTPSQFATRIQVSDLNSINRVLVDQKSGLFFGYTLKVEPLGNGQQYRVFLEPLGQEHVAKIKNSRWYEQAHADNAEYAQTALSPQSGRKPQTPQQQLAPVTRYPAPQTLDDGDTIAVDVLVNPTTGTRLSDRITISSKNLPASAEHKKLRDFSLDDIEIKLSNHRLLMNGQMLTQNKPQPGCAGPLVWFYIPGQGRFVFSIKPREGYDFQRLATVEDNKISFALNGTKYEWLSESPILGNSGKWNLWVLHDPEFQPPDDEFVVPTSLENLRELCCLIGAATNLEALFSSPRLLARNAPTAKKFRANYRAIEPNLLAPELYAEELQLKHVLTDLPGASLPESTWNVRWQVWFIPEAEELRVQEELRKSMAPQGGAFGFNPRPETYRNKIALGEGSFQQTKLATPQDRINVSHAFPFKAKIPAHLQTKFALLMTSYTLKIFDARLLRTLTRTGVWLTRPFVDEEKTGRAVPRRMLYFNWQVVPSGDLHNSQLPQ